MKTTFSNPQTEVLTGIDNVVIPQLISAIPNGRTLDMTGYADKSISAGWVIVTDSKGTYKPLAVTAATPAAYEKTTDAAIDNAKTYYTENGGEYIAVASPDVADIGSYYELKTPAGAPAYVNLPDGWAYAGILAHSLLAARPAATIMTAGQVNEVAAPNAASLATIKAAVKAALPGIQFIKEEYA